MAAQKRESVVNFSYKMYTVDLLDGIVVVAPSNSIMLTHTKSVGCLGACLNAISAFESTWSPQILTSIQLPSLGGLSQAGSVSQEHTLGISHKPR